MHFVAGEETAEVEWGISKPIVCNPLTHASNHCHIVVDGRDDEVGEFDPYACIPHGENGVEYGSKLSAADVLIDMVAKRLQVYVGGIEVG